MNYKRGLRIGPAVLHRTGCVLIYELVQDLSYLLKTMGQGGKSTATLRCYRDIVEWAVLYDMICNPQLQWGGDTILVRDGYYAPSLFAGMFFPRLRERIKAGIEAHAQQC